MTHGRGQRRLIRGSWLPSGLRFLALGQPWWFRSQFPGETGTAPERAAQRLLEPLTRRSTMHLASQPMIPSARSRCDRAEAERPSRASWNGACAFGPPKPLRLHGVERVGCEALAAPFSGPSATGKDQLIKKSVAWSRLVRIRCGLGCILPVTLAGRADCKTGFTSPPRTTQTYISGTRIFGRTMSHLSLDLLQNSQPRHKHQQDEMQTER